MHPRWHSGLVVLLAAGALARPAFAVHFAEARGDFYYDSQGQFAGMRNVEMPADFERHPMSTREKLELLGLQLPPVRALTPRTLPVKPDHLTVTGRDRNEVAVKFVDATRVRLRDGRLRADGGDLPEVEATLARFPGATVLRLFGVEERILDENKDTGERIGGAELPDLNNWYLVRLPAGSTHAVDVGNALLPLDIVEYAYLPSEDAPPPVCADVAPATPNWVANQFYLNAAPAGVDAYAAWAYHAGGNGAGTGFWVADLEYAWCYTPEDVNVDAASVLNGITVGPYETPDHGEAVLSEMGACDNAYGLTGIASDVSLRMIDRDSEVSMAAAVALGDSWLVPGEILIIEQQVYGPSLELLPVEWELATFNAIQTATANGIVVVEAAANGGVNLDNAAYGGLFNRAVRDSRAILVGAGAPTTHSPLGFSNYGSRLDAHGYGSNVYAMGYGDLFNQTGCTQDYTAVFNGTSSATPIVTGACIALQGIANAKYGYDLSALQMRSAVVVGATPQGAPVGNNIGPMPDLADAIHGIEPDLVASYVPGGWSYPLVPRTTTDSNGGYAPLGAGALPGNAAATYWNWTERNASLTTPTLNSPHAALAVDDGWLWECYNGNFAPGEWQWCGNLGANQIKGGRHTVLNRADWQNVEAESDEGNNDWARQFIWSGLPLAVDVPVSRTWDPPRTSTGWGPWYNSEGFEANTGSNYWYAFAVMPTVVTDDYDIRLHTEAPANIPQQGFGSYVASSGFLSGEIDYVVLDRNLVSGGTYWTGVINYSAGTGNNKIVEFDMDHGGVANPGVNGPYSIAAGNLVNLHEIYLAAGTQTRIQVQWLSGNADYGLTVHRDPSGFSSKSLTIPGGYANNAGAGGDEWVIVSPAASAYHGIVVWKARTPDLPQTLAYNLIVSQAPNLTAATPTGWYGPIVPRNTIDAMTDWCPLPATLNGNQTTTSYNFSTFNEGPNSAPSPWETRLLVDDVYYWHGSSSTLAPGAFARWMNSPQGLDPYSLVRGGRHHLRIDADWLEQLPEMFETDNTFVDWFVWTPYDLASDTPVIRDAPPLKNPVGVIEYSVDGFRSVASSYWTGVAVLPQSAAADYDVQLFPQSTGSRDGFGAELEWSGDAQDGAIDYAFVNYNITSAVPYDYGILNWNADASACSVQRASSVYWGSFTSPGVHRFGPFTLGPNETWDLHEFSFGTATPVYISVNNLSGNANLWLGVHDGNVVYHTKFSATAHADAGGNGADEHLAPISGAGQFWAVAVAKSGSADLPKTATYEVVVSIGGSAVDAPVVEAPPERFALSMPRPNPFGNETMLRFDVPANAGAARVSVYDLSGRRVVSLAEGERPAGRYTLAWDGRDAAGRKVAAGVYFVRMETPVLAETRKLTLLR